MASRWVGRKHDRKQQTASFERTQLEPLDLKNNKEREDAIEDCIDDADEMDVTSKRKCEARNIDDGRHLGYDSMFEVAAVIFMWRLLFV